MNPRTWQSTIQYICAVILIVSSIVLAFVQVLDIDTIASGTLMYIAQAFLLAGSIFGLEYYILKLNRLYNATAKDHSPGNTEQQPAEH